MNLERPRIAYVSADSPLDRRAWSGTHWYAAKAAQARIGDVSVVGPLNPPIRKAMKGVGRVARATVHRQYPVAHNWLLSRAYARMITKRLEGQHLDAILAVSASAEIASLERVSIPIVLCADATFEQMRDYYAYFSDIPAKFAREANAVERAAIQRANLLVYASDWAAQSAVSDYGADPAKVVVIPFGANTDVVPSFREATERIRGECCRLLFVGVDWERKGGSVAFNALCELEKRGVPTELIVCGCVPPSSLSHPNMTVIPFLNKSDPEQRAQLANLYLKASFFVLPTRAEAAGIVFAEAAAYGLPVITSNTGGVSGMVVNGRNGMTLPPDATGDEYARAIDRIWNDTHQYRSLVRGSRMRFDTVLNWDAWGMKVNEVLEPMLDG